MSWFIIELVISKERSNPSVDWPRWLMCFKMCHVVKAPDSKQVCPRYSRCFDRIAEEEAAFPAAVRTLIG
jgi:hypothetical protein